MTIILSQEEQAAFNRLYAKGYEFGMYDTHTDRFIPFASAVQDLHKQIEVNSRLGNLFFADEVVKDCQTLLIPLLMQSVPVSQQAFSYIARFRVTAVRAIFMHKYVNLHTYGDKNKVFGKIYFEYTECLQKIFDFC